MRDWIVTRRRLQEQLRRAGFVAGHADAVEQHDRIFNLSGDNTAVGRAFVDVSLDRVRYLRSTRDAPGAAEQCAAKQGVLGPQWQRPELRDVIYGKPLREAAE